MARETLTDRRLKALKPADPGKRYDLMDAVVPGFGVRITDKADGGGKAAVRTFILLARYPGTVPNKRGEISPTRRAIGKCGAMTLEQARAKARDWHEMILKGIDPADEKRRAAEAEIAKRAMTFGAVMEKYIARKIQKQRRAVISEREIRRELIPVWRDKPIAEISKDDVVRLVEAIADRPAPYTAHNCYGHIRTFFNWAIGSGILDASPCDRLKPKQLIGKKEPRKRVLNDDELIAYQRAAKRLGYPFGPLFVLLALTGGRKAEVGEARWREFDLAERLWIIPPERFKSDATHIVPLTDEAMAVLKTLPRFKKGDFLFSTTFGEKPVNGFSKAKVRLDREMLVTLKALQRGDDPREVELEPFVIHDVRRTVRTGLSKIGVTDTVAELVIGHTLKGLHAVYNQHDYLKEKREALALWAGELRNITRPTPVDNAKPRRGSG